LFLGRHCLDELFHGIDAARQDSNMLRDRAVQQLGLLLDLLHQRFAPLPHPLETLFGLLHAFQRLLQSLLGFLHRLRFPGTTRETQRDEDGENHTDDGGMHHKVHALVGSDSTRVDG
jgi:hypothetical protein